MSLLVTLPKWFQGLHQSGTFEGHPLIALPVAMYVFLASMDNLRPLGHSWGLVRSLALG